MKMEPEWDPKAPGADPAIHHPLFLQRPSARVAYDARVDRAAARAWEYGSEPSRTELAAARILRLEDAPRGLVEAVATALSRGAP